MKRLKIAQKLPRFYLAGEPYLPIQLPADIKTITQMFHNYNARLFNNEIPIPVFKISKLARNWAGLASCSSKDGKYFKFKIQLSHALVNNEEELTDTLLHEMVHIWQYHMVNKTGDSSYKDGHGPNFKHWVKKLNALGFQLSQVADPGVGVTMLEEYYGILYTLPDPQAVVFLYWDKNPEAIFESLTKQLEYFMGPDFYTQYQIIKSKHPNILGGVKITAQGKLRKNSIHLKLSAKWMKEDVLPHSQILFTSDPVTHNDNPEDMAIPRKVIALMPKIHKWRAKRSLDTYQRIVLLNTRLWKNISDMPQEVLDYIKEDWEAVTDVELRRSDFFKRWGTKVLDLNAIVRGKPARDKTIQEFWTQYKTSYAERVDPTRIKKNLELFLANALVKAAKKWRLLMEPMGVTKKNAQQYIRNYLKGTMIENPPRIPGA